MGAGNKRLYIQRSTIMGKESGMSDELFARGLGARKRVLGAEYVEDRLQEADRFGSELERFETEFVWGLVWSRPGLDAKTRCMLNLAMMTALNRSSELKLQMQAALRNGCSREEIVEVLLQANAYCGGPAGVEAFRVAREVLAVTMDAGRADPQRGET
jgi:alkylhydroperoxidase/carboxymuconolactone decarboxylase family protein YurZ